MHRTWVASPRNVSWCHRAGCATGALLLLAAAAAAAATPDLPLGLEEIVVTATRRETRLLDTPMSITVLRADDLRATGADDFADFARLVPGLTWIDSGPGNKRYALRGLQSAGEPEVALYYDEIPVRGLPGFALDTGDSQLDLKLFDVERIEVLRGPQGTLYGNGAMGGTLRILSKRPALDTFEGAVEAQRAATDGGDGSWRVNGMVNAPVVAEKLAIRAVGYYRREGGWIDDHYRSDIALPQVAERNHNDEDTWGGRVAVNLQATDRWNLTVIAYYQDLETGSSFETYPTFATPDDRYVSKTFVHTPWIDKSRMFNLISTYDTNAASLVVIGSYQDRTLDRSTDTTRFLMSLFGCTEFTWNQTCFGPPILPANAFSREEVSAWSGEIRLVSRQPGPLQWTVGAFLQDAATYRRGQVAKVDENGDIEFDPSTGNALHRLFARTNHDAFEQYALFGECAYEIAPRLKGTVGLRWFHSYRSDQQVIVQQFFPGQPTGPQPFQEFSESDVFKKFELSYSFTPQALGYIQASQGFRAGGPNYPGGFTVTAPPYRSDSVWNYEAGWKLGFGNGRAAWTGAVFLIDWSDLQQLVPTKLFSYIANAGNARSDGFESEFSVLLANAVTLDAGVTYTNARLVGAQPVQANPDLQLESGDRLANVPRWTVNASASYSRTLSASYTGRARLDWSYQSSRGNIVATQNPAYVVIPDSSLVGLHLAVDRAQAWTAALDVTNLFNTFAEQSAKALDSNLVPTITAARPRTISLGLTYRF